MKIYQNYIFDFYGTLADIHINEQKSYLWKKMAFWYQMKGADYTPAEIKGIYHKLTALEEQRADTDVEISAERIFKRMFTDRGVEAADGDIADTAAMFRCISIESLSLFDGVIQLLQKLREAGKRIYLLSNAQHLFAVPEIKALGLYPFFDGILLSSDAGLKKPSPVLYLKLLAEYSLDPDNSLMVGKDDLEDCHGAAALGIDSCFLNTHMSPKRQMELPENCVAVTGILDIWEE